MTRVKRDTATHRLAADAPVDAWPILNESEFRVANGDFPVGKIDSVTLTGFRFRIGEVLSPVVVISGTKEVFPIQPHGSDAYPQFTRTGAQKDRPTFYANRWGANQAAGVETLGYME